MAALGAERNNGQKLDRGAMVEDWVSVQHDVFVEVSWFRARRLAWRVVVALVENALSADRGVPLDRERFLIALGQSEGYTTGM